MRNRDRHSTEKAQRDEALLAVAEAIVLERGRDARKHLGSIDEIDLVLLEVDLPLALVPREPHLQSVYTVGDTVKAGPAA
jgi:hypothetical protein